MTEEEQLDKDFATYCKAVISHIASHRDWYPMFNSLADRAVPHDLMCDAMICGVTMACMPHFRRYHLIVYPAADLERAASKGAELAWETVFGGDNGKQH